MSWATARCGPTRASTRLPSGRPGLDGPPAPNREPERPARRASCRMVVARLRWQEALAAAGKPPSNHEDQPPAGVLGDSDPAELAEERPDGLRKLVRVVVVG